MEATSLDNAVESLLSPEVGGEPTQEDNLRDAVDKMVEPTQDAESKAVEDTEEGEDVVAASDDDGDYAEDDDATEYTDEVEAVEDDSDALFDVTIDGKPQRWTLSQLKQSAAGQGYIQQKMRENAEAAKQIQEREAQLAQQQQHLLQLTQQLQQSGLQAPTPPSRELFESDPIGYMEEKLKYDEAVQVYNAKVGQIRQVAQQRQQQTEAQRQAYLQEQARLLADSIPDILHPEKGERIKRDLIDTGVSYGFSEEEMANVSDHRYVRALNDARKWRQLQANKEKATAKGENKKPVIKAGAKQRQDGQAATRKKQVAKARQTGDWTDLILDPNL